MRRPAVIVVLGGAVALIAAVVAWAAAGSLTFLGVTSVDGLGGAINVAVSPDGKNVYAVAISSAAVTTFARDAGTGAVTFVEQDKNGVDGVSGLAGARDVSVSPDGKNVYATGNSDGAVVTFARDAGAGALTYVEQDKDGVDGVDGLGGVWGVTVSADGKNVYTGSNADNAVATFARDAGTGALTFVEQDRDGVDGVDGLGVTSSVAVSPDGKSLYAAACVDAAIAAFSRDPATGALTFLEQEKNGVDGVDGLACARGVAVDPSGTSVYAASESDNAVVSFSRDAGTGALTFVEKDQDGVAGVDGLNGARDVTTAPDCSSVYVASARDDAVVSFSRDAATSALTFVEQDKDGVDGVDGVDQAVGVAVAPSGSSLYVAAEFDDALTTFTRELPAVSACPGASPTPSPGPTTTPIYTIPTVSPSPSPAPTGSATATLRPVFGKVAKRFDRKRRLTVRLRCAVVGTGTAPAVCAGRLRAAVKRKAAGSKRFSFSRSKSARVRIKVKLSKKARRKKSVRLKLTATVGARKATKTVKVRRAKRR